MASERLHGTAQERELYDIMARDRYHLLMQHEIELAAIIEANAAARQAEQEQITEQILELSSRGYTMFSIASKLKLTETAVRRILRESRSSAQPKVLL